MKKRLISLVLVLLMLVPCIAACKSKKAAESDSRETGETVSTEPAETRNKYDVQDDLGEIDLGGKIVTIAQSGISDYENEVCVSRLTGDLVNDAIYRRNAAVEKRLNAFIENKTIGNGVYTVLNDLEQRIMSGTVSYDLIQNPVYSTCAYTTRGLYRNLNTNGNIDLEKPYWSSFVNEALSIGGVQYVASGAISLSFYKFMFVTAVNNRMLEDYTDQTSADLLKNVTDGDWTLEYQRNLISNVYLDQGPEGKDEEDIFGFVTSTDIHVDPYVSAGDVQVLSKGADGFYSWDFNIDRASAVMDEVVKLFTENATYCVPGSAPETVAEKFATQTAMMATLRLYEIENASIREMKDSYTLVPIPKYSTYQEKYYSLLSDRFTGVVIPISVADENVENMGAVLEALASESYRKVAPAYYEIVLKTRYLDSEANWNVMDMMIQNVKMDAILPYTAALELSNADKNTFIKLWRYVVRQSYWRGATSEMASTFNPSIGTQITEKLDGESGLQTYIRKQLANP